MKSGKNSFWGKYGRYIASLTLAAAVGAAVSFAQWRYDHDNKPIKPVLSGVAAMMRQSTTPWSHKEKDASALLEDIHQKNVTAVGVTMNAMLVSTKDDQRYYVTDRYATFSQSLVLNELKSEKTPEFQVVWLPDASVGPSTLSESFGMLRDLLGVLFPVLMIGGMVWYMRREIAGGASLLSKTPEMRFSDVIGAKEAKSALEDIKAYLKDPKAFTKSGTRPPCGVLMVGGPGVGKTRLAQALAGECNANFIAITGSHFSAKYYGVGIQKVKHLFELARKNAPCIIWVDEADGMGARTNSGTPVEAESNRIVNQLLAEMDGFEKNEGVIILAATNHPENMDEALRRPGRFDRHVHVRLPDVADRAEMFRFYAKKLKPLPPDLDADQLARLTTGLSPASIAMIVNQAGLVARKRSADVVGMEHFREAIKIVRVGDVSGAESALTEDERKRIAVHEGGHSLVASILETGVLEEVTILPRGGALGAAFITKMQDKQLYLESELRKEILVMLGGRNAELVVFNEASSGAGQDLKEASKISLQMVSSLGFNKEGDLFSFEALPQQVAALQMRGPIEQANTLLRELDDECRALITEYEDVLQIIYEELLRSETVPGSRVRELIAAHRAGTPAPELVAA